MKFLNLLKQGTKHVLKQETKNIFKLILTPIIGTLLVAYIFGHNAFIENIPFGIVDNDNSTLSRSVIQQLQLQPGLNVNYYLDSESELEEAIKDKKVNGGIVIPEHFGKDVSAMKSPSALILADGTNMVLGGNALGYASAVLGTLNAGVQINVFQGRGMLPPVATQTISNFSYVNRVLYDPQSSYLRNLIYIIIPFTAQMAFVTSFLVPLLLEKKKEFACIKMRSKEGVGSILNLIGRIFLISTVTVISTFIALCIVRKLYGIPLRGEVLIYIAIMYLFLISLTAIGLVISSIVNNLGYFLLFFNTINQILIMTCGVTYPEYMMPDGFAQAVKFIWPFRSAAIPLKFLNLKGVGWDVIFPYIKDGLLYTAFWLPVGIILYSAKIAFTKNRNKKSLDIKEDSDGNLLDIKEELIVELN